MDRMPKEYKIAIYILFIGLLYFALFSYTLFIRFKIIEHPASSIILTISIIIFLIYSILTLLLFLKKEISRILLMITIAINIMVNIVLVFLMVFFKEFAVFVSKTLKVSPFEPYLFMGITRLTPNKTIIISIIEIIWLIYLIYLLNHKELKEFIKAKDYPLVNTQRFTIGIVILLFISLAIIGVLFGL